MNNPRDNREKSTWKQALVEWGVIGAVATVIYLFGFHTEIIGNLQRAVLWTGFFDADTSQITMTDGPILSNADFNFSMENSDGEMVSLNKFRGDVMFVNVWASWCPPCIAEMPTIETLYENVRSEDNIRFIVLSLDEEQQKAVEFMENKDFDMPYYFPASSLPNQFRSQYLPTTYVISKEGQIVYKKEGIADYSSANFAQWMRELARES